MTLITARDLGIRYYIRRRQHRTLRKRLLQWRSDGGERRAFWALRQVSFDLAEGDVLGVVGPNGAGKSTLCKVLAGILAPDEGTVDVRGHVSPLLGLGAAFIPDLTGRENIHVSGALMGLAAEEVIEREAAIVDFADIGEFMDNPVRMYSAGMRSRLGFAIATAIEPAVLILDEVLSVGDTSFQAKCTVRIRQLMEHARAIVFVSHNLYSLRELCTTVMWLDKGTVRAKGATDEVVSAYEQWSTTNAGDST